MKYDLLAALGVGLLLGGAFLLLFLGRSSGKPQLWFFERTIYRYHRLVGSFILCGSFLLVFLLTRNTSLHDPSFAVPPSDFWRITLWLRISGWVLTTFVLIVGLAVFFRPSVLKKLEAWGNRTVLFDTESMKPITPIFGFLMLVFGIALLWITFAAKGG